MCHPKLRRAVGETTTALDREILFHSLRWYQRWVIVSHAWLFLFTRQWLNRHRQLFRDLHVIVLRLLFPAHWIE